MEEKLEVSDDAVSGLAVGASESVIKEGPTSPRVPISYRLGEWVGRSLPSTDRGPTLQPTESDYLEAERLIHDAVSLNLLNPEDESAYVEATMLSANAIFARRQIQLEEARTLIFARLVLASALAFTTVLGIFRLSAYGVYPSWIMTTSAVGSITLSLIPGVGLLYAGPGHINVYKWLYGQLSRLSICLALPLSLWVIYRHGGRTGADLIVGSAVGISFMFIVLIVSAAVISLIFAPLRRNGFRWLVSRTSRGNAIIECIAFAKNASGNKDDKIGLAVDHLSLAKECLTQGLRQVARDTCLTSGDREWLEQRCLLISSTIEQVRRQTVFPGPNQAERVISDLRRVVEAAIQNDFESLGADSGILAETIKPRIRNTVIWILLALSTIIVLVVINTIPMGFDASTRNSITVSAILFLILRVVASIDPSAVDDLRSVIGMKGVTANEVK